MGFWGGWFFFSFSHTLKLEVSCTREKRKLEDAAGQLVDNIFPQCKTSLWLLLNFKNQ